MHAQAIRAGAEPGTSLIELNGGWKSHLEESPPESSTLDSSICLLNFFSAEAVLNCILTKDSGSPRIHHEIVTSSRIVTNTQDTMIQIRAAV